MAESIDLDGSHVWPCGARHGAADRSWSDRVSRTACGPHVCVCRYERVRFGPRGGEGDHLSVVDDLYAHEDVFDDFTDGGCS
jgi:hypothetical protein